MKQRMTSPSDYNDVANVAQTYVEALRVGSVEMLADVFHENSVTYGTVNGELVGGGSGNPATDFIKMYGKSQDLVSHVDVLDLTPTTAVVRIVLEKDAIGSDCTENLMLIKLDEGWKIMAKVFHQF